MVSSNLVVAMVNRGLIWCHHGNRVNRRLLRTAWCGHAYALWRYKQDINSYILILIHMATLLYCPDLGSANDRSLAVRLVVIAVRVGPSAPKSRKSSRFLTFSCPLLSFDLLLPISTSFFFVGSWDYCRIPPFQPNGHLRANQRWTQQSCGLRHPI